MAKRNKITNAERFETFCEATNGNNYSLYGQAVCRVFKHVQKALNPRFFEIVLTPQVPLDVVDNIIATYHDSVVNNADMPELSLAQSKKDATANQKIIQTVVRETGYSAEHIYHVLFALDYLAQQGQISGIVAYPRTQGNTQGILPTLGEQNSSLFEEGSFSQNISTLKWMTVGILGIAGLYFAAQTAGVVKMLLPSKKSNDKKSRLKAMTAQED